MELPRRTLVSAVTGLLLLSGPCSSQSMRPEDLAQGKIIVTPRDSPDPHFANSVIVLARYGKTGVLGLMLHYKSDLTIAKLLAGIPGAQKRNDPLFVGGPVEIPSPMGLLRSKTPPAFTGNITGNVTGNLYLLPSRQSIAAALKDGSIAAANLRIFIGYSGWGPGQLEREVQRHGWYIFDYNEDLVFDEHPDTLWERMIDKTERQIAILRH